MTEDSRVNQAAILLIDDDRRLADMVGRYLGQSGYRITHCDTGAAGLQTLAAEVPDLVLLDLMLPDADGLDLCRQIRQMPGGAARVPVLMLTARGETTDRIVGLEVGADDYLPKPFEPRELLARVRALLRRAAVSAGGAAMVQEGGAGAAPGRQTPGGVGHREAGQGAGAAASGSSASGPAGLPAGGSLAPGAGQPGGAASASGRFLPDDVPEILVLDDLEIDLGAHEVRVGGERRTLTNYQFELLLALARHAGRVMSRERLMDLVKGESLEAFDRSIDVHVGKIRQAIETDPRQPRRLLTVRGVGYVFARPNAAQG